MSGDRSTGRLATMAWGLLVALSVGPAAYGEERAPLMPARLQIPLGLDAYMPIPKENPLTREKVDLGRQLFSEPLLSRDRSRSCASCHDPGRSFTDGKTVAQGLFGRRGDRNVPTLINRGWGATQFWDGRAETLEQTVVQPIENPKEMGLTIVEAVQRLRGHRSYRRQFRAAFGRDVEAIDLAQALASYVRTILSGSSAYDRHLSGDREALSPAAQQGLEIFRGKGKCTTCHVGPNLTDERFHNTGAAWRDGRIRDSGHFASSGRREHRGAFKTPTLRQIEETGPYMHDGSLATLEAVIDFYDRGGNANPYLDDELRPLHLVREEKAALLAFLRAQGGVVQEGFPADGQ